MNNVWHTLWAICGGAVLWALTIERRMAGKLGKEKHEDTCAKNQVSIMEKLEKIADTVDTVRQEGNDRRVELIELISEVKVKVAVLEEKVLAIPRVNKEYREYK